MANREAETTTTNREPVWPFAAVVASAAAAVLTYAALTAPPAWLVRVVIVLAGGEPSNSHAVQLGLVMLILARGLKLRRLIALYFTGALML